MQWVVVLLSLAGAQAAYQDYPSQHQSVALSRRYQGPPVVPVVLPGGFIADTEEVARAKSLHFNAYAHAASSVKDDRYNPQDDEGYSQVQYSQPQYTQAVARQPTYNSPQEQVYAQPQRQQNYNVPQHRYTGPAASPTPYTPTSPKQAAPLYQPVYSTAPQQRYQGPPVIPVVLPNGYIAETADVEAAKEHHFQLVAKAQEAVARAQERAGKKKYSYAPVAYSREDDGSDYEDSEQNYNQVYQTAAPSVPVYTTAPRKSYQGSTAVPVVLPSGHIADTAEVAAAKISHLQQLLDAAQKSLPQQQRYHR